MEINKMNKAQLIEVCEDFGFPKEEWEHLKIPELKEYVNSLMDSIKKEILIDLMNSEEEAPMDTYETPETPDSKTRTKN